MRTCCAEWRPTAAMLAVDVALGVMNILVKKSLDDGLNCLVLITFRQLVATLFMAPIAYFKERKSRPKLTWRIITQIFFSALLGASLIQFLFFFGMGYTSPTFACAFLNISPVFTFLIALSLRHEEMDLKKTAGKAKLLATIICVGGVAVLIFYRGMPIANGSHAAEVAARHAHEAAARDRGRMRWMLGSLALFAACLCWSAWFLVQARIGKQYPVVYSSTTIMFFLSFLQAAALTVATQRGGFAVWAIKGKVQIVTVLFAGIVGSGVGFLVMSWCVGKKGPVFTAAFSPLIQVVVAIIDFVLVREPIHLGSVLGSVLVVLGLYLLLWGKSKEAAGSSEVKPVQEGGAAGGAAGLVEQV